MEKRFLSLLLCLLMVFSLLPVGVLAGFGYNSDSTIKQTYRFYVDGELYATESIRSGETLKEPGVPDGDGEFLGWFTGSEKLVFDAKTFSASSSIDVTAKFRGVNYFYFMNSTGDDAIVVATKVLHDGDADITDFSDVVVPLDAQHGVTGWYTDKALTNALDSLSFDAARTEPVPLYPDIQKGFWVTFEANGGTYVAPQFCTVSANVPAEPTKFGYDFVGWYMDNALTVPANFASIQNPVTLYANWTPKTDTRYTVIHWQENANDDEYSYTESEYQYGSTEDLTSADAKEYEGFTAHKITQEKIKGDGSTIVNVYYKRNVYVVRFWEAEEDEDGSITGKTTELERYRIEAKYGADIANRWPGGAWRLTKDHSGYYQAYLKLMPIGGRDFYYDKNAAETGSADYYIETLNDDEYILDHTDYGAPLPEYNEEGVIIRYEHVDITEHDCYDIEGFMFKEYVTTSYEKDGKINYEYRGAKFYYTRNTYNIAYMNKSKNPVKVTENKYQSDISDAGDFIPDRPYGVPEDYHFAGWFENEECTKPYVFTGKTMPAHNVTVYANWVAPVCDVEFIAYGKTIELLENVPYGKDVADRIPSVTLRGNDEFYGWTYDEAGTQPFYPGTLITKSITLYAQIGDKEGYTVTYDANGGTGTVPVDTYRYGWNRITMALSASDLTPAAGKIFFLGWNTAADGSGTTYYPFAPVTVNGNITLYAIWGDTLPTVTDDDIDFPIIFPDPIKVTVIKTDSADNSLRLAGAKFDLYRKGSDRVQRRDLTTDEDGKVILRNLNRNTEYYLVETAAPAGYVLNTDKVSFRTGTADLTVYVENTRAEAGAELNRENHFAYVNGYPDGLVRPENNITRAEVAAILYRLMEESSVEKFYKASCGFYDVAADAWYSTYVSTLDNAGVITDSASGYFRPDEAITRAELAAMLAPFATVTGAKNTFSDVSDTHWAADAIAVCAKMGWIKGYPDGTFRPDQTITRAEMMAMVNRALDRTPQTVEDLLPDMKTWADNADTDMWYYLDVQEATNSHTYVKSDAHETWEKLIPDMGF